jgi:hypothetical protein
MELLIQSESVHAELPPERDLAAVLLLRATGGGRRGAEGRFTRTRDRSTPNCRGFVRHIQDVYRKAAKARNIPILGLGGVILP